MKEKAFVFYEFLNECKALEEEDLAKVLEELVAFTNKLIKERQAKGIELQPFGLGGEKALQEWLDPNFELQEN